MTGRTLVEDAIQCGGTNPNIGVNCMRVVCTHSRVGFTSGLIVIGWYAHIHELGLHQG